MPETTTITCAATGLTVVTRLLKDGTPRLPRGWKRVGGLVYSAKADKDTFTPSSRPMMVKVVSDLVLDCRLFGSNTGHWSVGYSRPNENETGAWLVALFPLKEKGKLPDAWDLGALWERALPGADAMSYEPGHPCWGDDALALPHLSICGGEKESRIELLIFLQPLTERHNTLAGGPIRA
jgi:hypothetical protein